MNAAKLKEIKIWMRANREDYREHHTGEINTTLLAEGAAFEADVDEELDDETSPLWEAALQISERFEASTPDRSSRPSQAFTQML